MLTELTRTSRQEELLPGNRLEMLHACIVGVGAVGHQVALQLASLGCPRLTLIDPDTVNPENLGPQGYQEEHLGQYKATATANNCFALNSECRTFVYTEKFDSLRRANYFSSQEPVILRDPAVFCCVDSMEIRKLVWESLHAQIEFFVDGRAAAENVRVLGVVNPAECNYYPTTLFSDSEAFQGSCTSRMTIYTAAATASLMLAQFARWLRGHGYTEDVTLNLNTMELGVTTP